MASATGATGEAKGTGEAGCARLRRGRRVPRSPESGSRGTRPRQQRFLDRGPDCPRRGQRSDAKEFTGEFLVLANTDQRSTISLPDLPVGRSLQQWQCHGGSLLAMEYGKRWDFVKVPGSRIENDRGKPLSLGIRNLEAPASAFWCLVGWWFTRLGRVASSAGLRGPDSRKAGFHWAAAGLIESGRAHSRRARIVVFPIIMGSIAQRGFL